MTRSRGNSRTFAADSGSELFGDEPPSLERRLIVIRPLLGAFRQLQLLPLDLLVGNPAEQVRDAVETGALLVVRADEVPGRVLRVGRLEHHVAGAGVVVPALAPREVHVAQLPLPEGIGDARLEAALLLVVPDLEPVLEEDDSALDDVLLGDGTELEEAAVLLLR